MLGWWNITEISGCHGKCRLQFGFYLKQLPCWTGTTQSTVVEICPLSPTSHQLGRCNQGRPENQKNYAQVQTKAKGKTIKSDLWIQGRTMSNCWKMDGSHLLICFFKKLPLVRKPCRHSTLAFLSCSMCSILQRPKQSMNSDKHKKV